MVSFTPLGGFFMAFNSSKSDFFNVDNAAVAAANAGNASLKFSSQSCAIAVKSKK